MLRNAAEMVLRFVGYRGGDRVVANPVGRHRCPRRSRRRGRFRGLCESNTGELRGGDQDGCRQGLESEFHRRFYQVKVNLD